VSSLSSPKRRTGRTRVVIAAGLALAVFAVPAVAFAAGTFTDVSSKNAYYKDVKAAVANGVMAGCTKTKFCPKTAATRQDVARLANRLGALDVGTKPIVNAKTALTAGSALTAATATNAGHATTADSATSATDAAALGGVAASGYIKNAGEVLISAPTTGWTYFGTPTTESTSYYSDVTRFGRSTAGTDYVENGFSLPTALYGNQMSVAGVLLCYNASFGASITDLFLTDRSSSAGPGINSDAFYDGTARTDAACRTYAVSPALVLNANDSISMFVHVSFGVGTIFDMTSATLILVPTGSAIAPLSRPLAKGPLTVLKPFKGRLPFASR
jgi:hypothetical protein